MSADKLMQLQKDVRHNQEDHQSFLRDMNAWEKSVKKQDLELKKGNSPVTEKTLPPIRNKKLDTKKRRKKKKDVSKGVMPTPEASTGESSNTQSQSKKIRGYDYRSWDKFDVDAACAAIDSDDEDGGKKKVEEEEEEETDSEEEQEMEIQRKMMEANAEKEKGNAFFKKGKYEEAVAHYSKGLEADPNNAILSANKAMALLKLKRYEEAEKDCNAAIELDCTYVKAYARRATARLELGKLEEAQKDFEQVLNIETENKQAKNELRKIERLLKEREEERRRAEEPSNVVHAIEKLPHLRSKKPLKRMKIQEIGEGVAEEKQREKEAFLKQTQNSNNSTPSDSNTADNQPSRLNPDTTDIKGKIQEIKSRPEESEKKQSAKEPNSHAVKSTSRGNSPRDEVGKPPSSEVGKSPSTPAAKPAVPGIPSSSVQLQIDLKRLKPHPDVLFEYFKKIPPASYPKLLQNSLDSALLTQILTLLKDTYIKSHTPVFETLTNLSVVKRFDMNVMFMSSKEKQVVRDLFDHMKSEEGISEQECQQLAKKYGL